MATALMAYTAAGAGAAATVRSGDTCTATGKAHAFTVQVTIPSGAPAQYGFAFGASGASITNVDIPGTNGNFSTANLAPNTTAAWVSDTPLTGAPSASLSTTGNVPGSFMIVPAAAAQSRYYSPVKCTVSNAAPARTATLSVNRHVTYSPSARGWRLVVAIAAAGTVSAVQPEPTIGTGSSTPVTAKPLVQAHRVGLKTAGKVTLTLRTTSKGAAALAARGSLDVKVRVTFDAVTGKSASKLIALTLKK
ncbi:MAG TPA: hypothetical protein VGM80_15350 [Gaiellaceae bacterium]